MTLPIYLTILGTIAFLAAVIGVFGLFVVSRGVARFSTRGVINMFLWLIVLATIARIMGSSREYLQEVSVTLSEYGNIMPWVAWYQRLSSVMLVGVAVMSILVNWGKRSELRGGFWLWIGLIALFLASFASSALGTKPAFHQGMIYTLLLMMAIMLSPPITPELMAVYAKRVLALLLYGSLILALIQPEHYLQTGYSGIIPGFSIRLHGLAQHANTLGPLALLYLLLAYWVPGKRYWHLLGNLVALAVLVLAQSKTTWMTAMLAMLLLLTFSLSRQAGSEIRSARIGWVTAMGLGLFFVSLLSILALFVTVNPLAVLNSVVTADSELTTLTGRTGIWETTIKTWVLSPWFGYGPTLWDFDFRLSHGAALAAWHAHNQFIQALGEAGLVGLAGLLLYVGAFLGYGIKYIDRTRGVSLALVLLLLIRSITEVPFKLSVLLDASYLIHLIVFAVLVMLTRQASDGRERRLVVTPPQVDLPKHQ